MAVLGTTVATLADVAKRTDPSGRISDIVEILKQDNEVLDDMAWMEGNLETGHRTTVRTGLPTPTWRRLNYGVQPTKSTTVQITDNCGMLEAYAEVDKDLAMLNGNTAAFRLSEDTAHIQGISHAVATTIFYGNEGTAPAQFTGLAPRYNSLSGAESSQNVITGGGSGSDNSSIWLVVWGPNSLHGIYPKASTAGLQQRDMGEVTLESAPNGGGRMQAYRTHYQWKCGLTVRDWRYAVRIANIDVSDLKPDAASGADLVDLCAQALEKVQNLNAGRPAFYMNRTVRSVLRRQLKNAANVNLTLEQATGRHVMSIDGVPVRRCDAILNTEAALS